MSEYIRKIKINKVTPECTDIVSLWFEDSYVQEAQPGQYMMVWIPGLDEIPMSVSNIDEDGLSSMTVRIVGQATEILGMLTPGDTIGIRGPFGNGYKMIGTSPLIVAGGSGAASLLSLVKTFTESEVLPRFVLGARNADMLLFEHRLKELLGENLLISTDDGSKGYSGYASGYAAKLMETEFIDSVYTCGPELMMAMIYRDARSHDLPIQASLERFIKCSVGLCGACAIGPYRVCVDGPVFDTEMLDEVKGELGNERMDPSGRVIRVDH
jgi:dihydroorotate dehydrogenase electron transfer subunit